MPRQKPKSKKIKIKVVVEKPSFAKATAGKEKKAPQKKEEFSVLPASATPKALQAGKKPADDKTNQGNG